MGHMVLKLVAVMPEPQMFFGAAEMILRTAADPIIVRMAGCTLPHHFSNYFQSLGEWFHSTLLLLSYSIPVDPLNCQSVSGRENLAK
jgi:hypothetical protein